MGEEASFSRIRERSTGRYKIHGKQKRDREEMSKKAASEMFLFRSVLSPRRASEAVSQTASVNGLVGRGQTIEERGGGRGKAIKEDAHPPFANDGEGFFF